MLLFKSGGQTRWCNGLAQIEQVPAGRRRQRLGVCSDEADARQGKKRRDVDVQTCCGERLASIVRHWQGEKHVKLAVDARPLGTRCTVLSLRVRSRGCALPVAWVRIRAQQQGSRQPHWEGR